MGLIDTIANSLDKKRKRDAIVIKTKNSILGMMTIEQLKNLYSTYVKAPEGADASSTVAGEIVKAIFTPTPNRQGYIDQLRASLTLEQIKTIATGFKLNIKSIIEEHDEALKKLG